MSAPRWLVNLVDRISAGLIDLGAIGLAWCDRHTPAMEIDEIIAELEAAHRAAEDKRETYFNVVVRLPRDHRNRKH